MKYIEPSRNSRDDNAIFLRENAARAVRTVVYVVYVVNQVTAITVRSAAISETRLKTVTARGLVTGHGAF